MKSLIRGGGVFMRIAIAAAIASLSTLGLSNAEPAAASIRKPVEIPAQSLEAALKSLAQLEDIHVMFVTDDVAKVKTAGVSGSFTVDEALGRLLDGTGLTYTHLDTRTISVVPRAVAMDATAGNRVSDVAGTSDSQGDHNTFWERFRLAQTDQGVPASPAPVEKKPREGSDQDLSRLEEVVVTAQKREERLIDVPISLVALSGDALEKRQISSIDDLPAAVPGLVIRGNGAYSRQVFLRGVGNISGTSSLVGIYLDDTSMTSAPATQFDVRTYDLDRIEVLRGPQGTLYGDGSIGGTIRFITRNPELTRLGANVDTQMSFTEGGAPSQRVQPMLNIPVIPGELGFRIAGEFNHDGGWIDQPAADRKDINSQNLVDARIKGLWTPGSRLTVSAMALIHHNDGSTGAEDRNGNFTQPFNLLTSPTVKDRYDVGNLAIKYDLPRCSVINSVGYITQSLENRNIGSVMVYLPGAGESDSDAVYLGVDTKIFNDEFRLTSTGGGSWEWTIGSFYRSYRQEISPIPDIFGAAIPSGASPPGAFVFPSQLTTSKSWSVFGDTNYRLMERLVAGLGLRYFEDTRQYTTNGVTESGKFDATSPRAYASYKISDELNTYLSAAKGFRSGGFNPVGQPPYGPESVWTYELGAKASLFSRKLQADAAAFYSDYTNYQVFGRLLPPNPPYNIYSNSGSAWLKGIEWSVAWSPDSHWGLGLNGDYVASKFYKLAVRSSSVAVGDALDLVPKYAIGAFAQYSSSFEGRPLSVRLDYSQTGRESYHATLDAVSHSDVIRILNLHADMEWRENLRLELFVQNLLDNRGTTNAITGFAANSEATARSRPRTVGFGLKASF